MARRVRQHRPTGPGAQIGRRLRANAAGRSASRRPLAQRPAVATLPGATPERRGGGRRRDAMIGRVSARRPAARWVVAVGCAAVLVATAACSDSSPTRPPAPTRVHTSPIGLGEDGAGSTGGAASAALPTWTLPAAAPAPGGGPSRVSDPGSGAGPAAPGTLSGVPAPTVVPTPIGGLAGPPADDPEVLALMARVDGGRMLADVRKLADYKSRSAFSTPAAPAAHGSSASPAEWLRARFEEVSAAASAQLLVETEPFDLGAGRGGRVAPEQQSTIATLSGIGARKRFVYAVAHLGSRGLDPCRARSNTPHAFVRARLIFQTR